MNKTNLNTLDDVIDSNYLSGGMVVFVLIELLIMIFDRILYSTHKFLTHQKG